MRLTTAVAAVVITATAALAIGTVPPVPARADPAYCDNPDCVPGIRPGVVLGATCGDTAYFVFGTTSWGRLVFCGSPRRYEPRYFRSPSMAGIRKLDSDCAGFLNQVAQAPDGLFLSCVVAGGSGRWVRGDM
ncbi:hypothetical protein [Mycolicibacterium sp. P9-22]|uniref:hypothetical protein n=1 Tax=Mycolicibacterium sp. P9-22 TaxID=2024613 RepID=UPI001883564D|nr:hypothetical protein [Mycolicibacterium sp. P9-22]